MAYGLTTKTMIELCKRLSELLEVDYLKLLSAFDTINREEVNRIAKNEPEKE